MTWLIQLVSSLQVVQFGLLIRTQARRLMMAVSGHPAELPDEAQLEIAGPLRLCCFHSLISALLVLLAIAEYYVSRRPFLSSNL